ncbi:MAG: hypothetical protein KA440_08260 [Azonexus sp.]|nr:hypothetical protein [Azonexus sp.]
MAQQYGHDAAFQTPVDGMRQFYAEKTVVCPLLLILRRENRGLSPIIAIIAFAIICYSLDAKKREPKLPFLFQLD